MGVMLSAARKISRLVEKWTTSKGEIQKLGRIGYTPAALLARALGRALKREISAEERERIDAIEVLRRRVNQSAERIRVRDLSGRESADRITEETTIGNVSRLGSKPYDWCLLLFFLVRELRPRSCLELGSCMGISASYQGAALDLNGAGRLTTIEGQPEYAAAASRHLESVGLKDVNLVMGRFQDVLPNILERHGRFDYVFIDGHHDEQATLAYFRSISPRLMRRSLVVFDDIEWSAGMRRAWRSIQEDDRLSVVVDLHKVGLTIFDPECSTRHSFKIAII